jgi:hypothetical protein
MDQIGIDVHNNENLIVEGPTGGRRAVGSSSTVASALGGGSV